MSMRILENGKEIDCKESFDSDTYTFAGRISWPSRITIEVWGKDLSCDTQVGEDGSILADKFIRLDRMVVDRLEVPLNKNKILLDTGTEKLPVVYWGFNGHVDMDFDEIDSFIWHLKQRSVGNVDRIYIQDRSEVQDLKYTGKLKVDEKYHPSRRVVIPLRLENDNNN
jgi:hypothetical protein